MRILVAYRTELSRQRRGSYQLMKLYMFYIGGSCGGSNVELHDVRFSVGDTPEDCHDDLRRQWWGDPKSLHLDCWGEVEQADGFDIVLSTTPPPSADTRKLFFLNLGGYDPREFSELHRNVLLVASDTRSAIVKALQQVKGWSLPHRDNVFEVENAIDLSAQVHGAGYFLTLHPASQERPFSFVCRYLRLA